jgi:hypothetical protein
VKTEEGDDNSLFRNLAVLLDKFSYYFVISFCQCRNSVMLLSTIIESVEIQRTFTLFPLCFPLYTVLKHPTSAFFLGVIVNSVSV